MILTGEKISYTTKENQLILNQVSLSIKKGESVGIVGPNGCGKTTLLKCLTDIKGNNQTNIQLFNKLLADYTEKELARQIGIMHQVNHFPFDFRVSEIIEMGRYPFFEQRLFLNQEDQQIIASVLDLLQLQDKKNSYYSTLSGGEKQRVLLGRALAQTPKLLILDEPTNHLDIYQQRELMKQVRDLKLTTLSVLHDLSLAYEFCDVIYILKNGQVCYFGQTKEVLTPEKIKEVFEIETEFIYSEVSKKYHLVTI